jgi:hypothetical protein
MRFVSHIRNFGVGILTRRAVIQASGAEQELVPGFQASFWQSDITAAELEFAERHFSPNGRTTEVDEVTLTPLLGRLSVYDTEAEKEVAKYDEIDEQMLGETIPGSRGKLWERGTMKRMVEEKLVARAATSQTFALVVEPRVAPPWPAYDSFPGEVEDLVAVIQAQGHHIPAVIAYERQNRRRADVIAALEDALAEQNAENPQPEFVS